MNRKAFWICVLLLTIAAWPMATSVPAQDKTIFCLLYTSDAADEL